MFSTAYNDCTWEIDQLKRTIVNMESDAVTLNETIAMVRRDNSSLKKVEKNMGSFLKSVMGNRNNSSSEQQEGDALVNAVAKGVKPLVLTPKNIRNANLNKAHNGNNNAGTATKNNNKHSGGSGGSGGRGGIRRPGSASSNKKDSARSTTSTSSRESRESTSARSINNDGASIASVASASSFSLPNMENVGDRSDRSDHSETSLQSTDSLPLLRHKKDTANSDDNKDNAIAASVIARTAQFLKQRQEGRPASRGASASRKRNSESGGDPGRGSAYDQLFQKGNGTNGGRNKENARLNLSRYVCLGVVVVGEFVVSHLLVFFFWSVSVCIWIFLFDLSFFLQTEQVLPALVSAI
jgi:hypothetical protein